MSDQLIVKMGGQIIETVTLDRPMMRIGRSEDCDVTLDDPEKRVSRYHAVLQRSSGRDEFKVKNDEGKTGTLVNNNRAEDWVVLKRGDLIQIGPFSLIYSYGQEGGDPDDADATMVALDAGEDLTVVGGDIPAAAGGTPSTVQHDATMAMPGGFAAAGQPLKLVFVKGPFKGGQQTITSPSFTIGRGQEQNAVWLKDETVSTQHAEISQAAGKYFVKDLGSQNGLLVNGKRVIGESELKNGDKITIGLSTFKVVTSGSGGGGGVVKLLGAVVGVLAVAAIALVGYKILSEKSVSPGNSSSGSGDLAQPGMSPVTGGDANMDTSPETTGPAAKTAAELEAEKLKQELAALKEQQAAAAAAKAEEEVAMAKKKAEEEAAMAKKKADEEAAMAKKKADEEAAMAKKKTDEEVAMAQKKLEEAAAPAVEPSVPTPAEPEPAKDNPSVAVVDTPAEPEGTDAPPVVEPGASSFSLSPIDPARKITPSEVIEYKSY